jgi:Fe-S oxidoreductase
MGILDRFKLRQWRKGLNRLKGESLYFPGCATQKFLLEHAENYKTILTDLGIPIKTLPVFCCGRPLKEQGYTQEYKDHVANTKAFLEEQGITSIITNCAFCMQTFQQDYGMRVKHTTDVIWEQRAKLQQFNTGEVTFQDNCVAARTLGLTNQVRDILVATGFRIKEFDEHKGNVRCCGGSCGLGCNAPTVAVKLAQRRLRDAPSDTIITDDPHCYLQLKRNTQKKEVLELSETLVEI